MHNELLTKRTQQSWARLWSRDWDWDLGGLSLGLKPWDPYSKSQYQSQFLRPNWRVSVSVSNFDTIDQKSRSQLQKINIGLAHPNFVNALLMIFNHMTSLFLSNIIDLTQCENSICVISSADLQHWCHLFKVSVSVSILETKVSLSLSLNFWDQSEKSWSQSQSLRPW